jgi:hypothetical protein
MRKSPAPFVAVLALSVAAAVAHAGTYQQPAGFQPGNTTWLQEWDNWIDQLGQEFAQWLDGLLGIPYTAPGSGGGQSGSGTVAAPEFDPASATAALTLLSGGLAVLRGRRSRRKDS